MISARLTKMYPSKRLVKVFFGMCTTPIDGVALQGGVVALQGGVCTELPLVSLLFITLPAPRPSQSLVITTDSDIVGARIVINII